MPNALITVRSTLDRPAASPAAVYLSQRITPQSKASALSAMRALIKLTGQKISPDAFPWADLRYEHTHALRARLAEKCAPATANQRLAILRGVLKEALRLGLMSSEDHARASDLPTIRGSRLPRGRALAESEIRYMLSSGEGGRARAIFALAVFAGARRDELVTLDLDSLQGGAVRIIGKGNKERRVPLHLAATEAIDSWLAIRGNAPGPLFLRFNKYGGLARTRLHRDSIAFILEELRLEAEVAPFTPHDLRRTFVTRLLAAGIDLAVVAKLAGHANVQTTMMYDRRGDEGHQAAIDGILRAEVSK